MGDSTALRTHVAAYELTDVLLGARPGTLVLVGEHTTSGEVVLERVMLRKCGYSIPS